MDWQRHPRIRRIAEQLWQGAVIAYPTEAVWGLGCAPFDEQAVRRLLALKQRVPEKGLILVAADIEQFHPYLCGLQPELRQRLRASWPGPVTWLVPDNGYAPAWIRGQHRSVALRVSDHPLVAGLCRAYGGPLVSTSANPQGKPPALTGLSVRRYFSHRLDDISPGVVGKQARPSEIRDLLTGEVLRAG